MKDRNTISRNKKKYLKEKIENAGCIDKEVLLEDILNDLSEKEKTGRYGLKNDMDILKELKVYILGNDLVYAEKYGLEEILKWEHLTL